MIDLDYLASSDEARKDYRNRLNISKEILLGHDVVFIYQKNQEILIEVTK